MPNGIGKFLPPPQGEGDHEVVVGVSHRRNAGDGVPYDFTKMSDKIRRGDSRIARRCRKDCA